MAEKFSTTWVRIKPEDVFPEIRKNWRMEVENIMNMERETSYISPTQRVVLVRKEQFRRGKWRHEYWRMYQWLEGKMVSTEQHKTRGYVARKAMQVEKEWEVRS